jgi:hypothetical protein
MLFAPRIAVKRADKLNVFVNKTSKNLPDIALFLVLLSFLSLKNCFLGCQMCGFVAYNRVFSLFARSFGCA